MDEGPAAGPQSKKPRSQPRTPPATRARTRGIAELPDPIARELARDLPSSKWAKTAERVVEAANAFDRDRPQDAMRLLAPVIKESPDVAAVRELAGLALYRQGRYAKAAQQLEAFRTLSGGSVEQHPVLADCYRALGRHREAAELWLELRQSSPGVSLLTEGRIVAAGSLTDQGDLRGAIALLEQGPVRPRRSPALHHLRLWYALADVYERSGDAARARELFGRVADARPDLADASARLAALA